MEYERNPLRELTPKDKINRLIGTSYLLYKEGIWDFDKCVNEIIEIAGKYKREGLISSQEGMDSYLEMKVVFNPTIRE